jgi:hypothetical protein
MIMGRHPYREAMAPAAVTRGGSTLDAEQATVYLVITVTGAIGVVLGMVCGRPTELALGAWTIAFAGRFLWRERRHAHRDPSRVSRD